MSKQLNEMTVEELGLSGRTGADLVLMGRQATAQIDSAKYMRWSVYLITATSAANALFAFLTWYAPHIPH